MTKPIVWEYGVTTVPQRKDELLPRTLRSLAEAGFPAPRLFVDGCDETQNWKKLFNLEVTARYPRIRTSGNWILGLAELWIRNPFADWYAMFQDDFVTGRNLREYFERCAKPEKSYFNLYTFQSNEKVIRDRPIGWHEGGLVDSARQDRFQTGRGAVALIFPKAAVVPLLTHQKNIVERPLDRHRGWRAIDGGIVSALNQQGWREVIHNPSLVQHVGKASVMGNKPHAQALSFKGEDFDYLELLQ